jgi:hypothetical protein
METTKVRITSEGHGFDSHVTTEDGKELVISDISIRVLPGEPVRATMTVLQPELDVTLELVDKAEHEAAMEVLEERLHACYRTERQDLLEAFEKQRPNMMVARPYRERLKRWFGANLRSFVPTAQKGGE